MTPLLVVVDFDGTVTQQDTLADIVEAYAPDAFVRAEEELQAGRISLRQCIQMEFEDIRADHDEVVSWAIERTHVRAGFARFVRDARAAGHRVVVVSSGFEVVIRPVLEAEGVGDIELVAHDVRFSPEGTDVRFRPAEVCDVCGEECKRPVVRGLGATGPVVYVGDGYSDRCAAMDAQRVFARAGLARFLDRVGVAYEPFEDFAGVHDALLGG